MSPAESESVIRQYAAGELTRHAPRERGFDNYLEVLAPLVEHGLN